MKIAPRSLSVLLGLLFFLYSCDKSDVGSQVFTQVAVNHFSPNTPALDLVLDGVVVNTDSIEYAETNPYIYTPSGERRVRLNRTGTSKNYFGADQFFETDVRYSIFTSDSLSAMKALILNDTHSAPAGGTAQIRFVHLVPDGGTVSLLRDTTVLTASVNYNTASTYLSVPTGNQFFTVKNGTSTSIYQTPALLMEDGKTYTLVLYGFSSNLFHQLLTMP